MAKPWILFVTVIACCMNQLAHAALITMDSDASGSVSKGAGCLPVGCVFQSYASINPLASIRYNFVLDIVAGRPVTAERTDKGYTVFDLSSLAQTVLGAKLEVDLQYTAAATSLLRD